MLERTCTAASVAAVFGFCFVATAHSALGQTVDPPSPAEPQHTVIPVHLDPASGDIKVGRTTYPGASPGLHMLALKRKPGSVSDTPDLIDDQTFTDADTANAFLQSVLAVNSDAFLIVNGVGNYGIALSAIASNLAQFGGQVDLEEIPSAVPFVFLGNGGRDKGGALQRGYGTLAIDGYLATDSNGNYAFIRTDYVRYDIATDGTVTIGNTAYPVANARYKYPGCDAAATDSFHLVVVGRESLAPLADNAYCTAQNPSHLGDMAKDLGGVSSEAALVFIATNGKPIPLDWDFGTDGDGRVYPLAQQMARFGGYFETMVYLTPADTYSLVGAPAPPSYVARAWSRAREASSVYPDHPTGELHGILARGRGNWYGPINADLSGQANLDFYDQVLAKAPAQPETTFPASGPAELTAFRYISCALPPNADVRNCFANPPSNIVNPRDQYGNTNVSIENYFTKLDTDTDLKSDPYNNNADCTDPNNPTKGSAYCTVRAQLLIEFQYVTDIRALASNLAKLGTVTGVDNLFDLIDTWQTVQATLPPPPQPTAPSLVSPIVNLVLGLAGAAPTPLAPLFGIADTFFNFGMSLTTDQSGNQTASLATPVANLADQAQKNFNAQLNSLGTQFDLIYQDWGKMQALGTLLQSGDPAWAWGVSTASDISNSMNPAVKQGMYQSLMPAVYAIGSYLPEVTPPAPENGWGNFPVSRQPNGYQVLVNRQSPSVPNGTDLSPTI